MPPASNRRPTGPVRVLMVGDSTAEALGVGLAGWAGANPTLADVRLAVSPGCGFVRGGEVATDGDVPFAERCDEILEHVLPDTLAEFRPEVVMLLRARVTWWIGGGRTRRAPSIPSTRAYQQRINDDYARIAELVTASGATASSSVVRWSIRSGSVARRCRTTPNDVPSSTA